MSSIKRSLDFISLILVLFAVTSYLAFGKITDYHKTVVASKNICHQINTIDTHIFNQKLLDAINRNPAQSVDYANNVERLNQLKENLVLQYNNIITKYDLDKPRLTVNELAVCY